MHLNQAHLFDRLWFAVVPSVVILTIAGTCGTGAAEVRSSIFAQQPHPALIPVPQSKNQLSPDLKALVAGKPLAHAVTSRTPSAVQLSMPSLWWISEQLAALDQFGNKFIQEWLAYPGQGGQPGQVDLLVNRQQWSLLDYLQRYEFVRKFSTVARGYGYNTRVYDSPDRLPVALYVCDFSTLVCNLTIAGASSQRRR